MDFLKVLTNEYFLFANCVIIILIAIVHFVFAFFIKETDFDNIFDAFESSIFLILVLRKHVIQIFL